MIQNSLLLPNQYFYIVHPAVGNELLFVDKGNKDYFLRQYTKYISPNVHRLANCLMPNHFHFMVPIKSEEELAVFFKEKFPFREWDPSLAADFLMQYWSNLLNSYTKSFNKKYKRKGALFMYYLRRVEIISIEQCLLPFFMCTAIWCKTSCFFVEYTSMFWNGYPFYSCLIYYDITMN